MIHIIIIILLLILFGIVRYLNNRKHWINSQFNSGHWIEYHKPNNTISFTIVIRIVIFLYIFYALIDIFLQ